MSNKLDKNTCITAPNNGRILFRYTGNIYQNIPIGVKTHLLQKEKTKVGPKITRKEGWNDNTGGMMN